MDITQIGRMIASKRKELGYTQQNLADKLSVSFQAVSKWENGVTYPDIELLPQIASLLNTTVDALFGYSYVPKTNYEQRYREKEYYWGLIPNSLCYEIMKLRPPVRPYRILDVGCGEGKDAVFLARNGYDVTAFDIAESGLEKARDLAKSSGVHVDFFKADITDYRLTQEYDIIFSSGVFTYLNDTIRGEFIQSLKEHTSDNGLNVINVFVEKPFIAVPPDHEQSESVGRGWKSGELFTHYHDWLFHTMSEVIFDCNSSGIPHKHCMDIMVSEKHVTAF